jgi:hypothetical protein
MMYKKLPLVEGQIQILARIDDDGKCRVTCTEQNPDYLKWVSEGNQPTPAEEVTQ